MNDSTYESDETSSLFDNDKDLLINSKIKQFLKDALILSKRLERSSIELMLSLSPIKFETVNGKEFIEKVHQIVFANSKILIEKLNDDDFISLFFTNQSQSLSRTTQHPNLSQFQILKRKSTSLSRGSNSHRSESDDFLYSKTRNFANDYSSNNIEMNSSNNEENDTIESDVEYQYSPKFNSMFTFTNKIFSAIHNLSLYFRFLNAKNKALKSEIKEIDSKSKSLIQEQEPDEVQNEILNLWANQLKKTNEVIKKLDGDVITPNGEEFIHRWMTVIQKRKEFIESLLNKQIDENFSSSLIEDKKSSISSVIQAIRKCLKNREDYEVITRLVSLVNSFLSKCKANTTNYPQNFNNLVDLIQKDIATLPQNPPRAARQIRGRISSNITQIITDRDKL